jgi:cytochrome c biogenesis protein CcmG, thiol:disulfide interchange protein DsbE
MMARSNPKTQAPLSKVKALPLLVTLLLTAALSFGFARAVSDSRAWILTSEQALINPTFVAENPSATQPIAGFTLPDRYGKPVRLQDFSGVDLLIVNIWTTSCPACEAELPSLEELDKRLHEIGNAVLLTITTNASFEEMVHLFPQGTDLRILFDPDEKVTKGIFGTSLFPETFVLDKQRRIRARFDGQRPWHSDEMLRYLATFK